LSSSLLSSGDADAAVNDVFKKLYPSSLSILLNIYMRYILLFLLSISVIADESPYSSISERNAFELTEMILPPASEILNLIETPKIELFLTGVTRLRDETKVHLYSKDLPNKYLSLKAGEQSGGVKVLTISRDAVKILNDGEEQVLTFTSNRIKTTVLGVKGKPTVVKKDSKDSSRSRSSKDKESKKSPITTPQASIVKVPSRRPTVDPRIIERGLEYLTKMEDGDRKEYLLKRIESLQSGQHQIKSDIDQNERRRQYDEWRKRRDGNK